MSAPPPSIARTPVLHATLIARRFAEGWRGALLRGPSGCGKSTLALRALDAGFRLVADDRVLVWTSGGRLFGRAPEALADLLEVRHVAVTAHVRLTQAPVDLVVDLDGDPERLPDPGMIEVGGQSMPHLVLRPFEACAPARLERALGARLRHV